jgi:hypothetical protein
MSTSGAPQRCFDTRDEPRRLEWFADVVVGARVHRFHLGVVTF